MCSKCRISNKLDGYSICGSEGRVYVSCGLLCLDICTLVIVVSSYRGFNFE
jgi:hypothetical protein